MGVAIKVLFIWHSAVYNYWTMGLPLKEHIEYGIYIVDDSWSLKILKGKILKDH